MLRPVIELGHINQYNHAMRFWRLSLVLFIFGSMLLSGCSGDTAKAELVLPSETKKAVTMVTTPVVLDAVATMEFISTASPTLRPSSTSLPSPTPIPSFTTVPSPTPIPDSFYISGVQSFRQSYPLSCESRTAVDWADFFGVLVFESDFQFGLPRSDNPDKGFVGEVHDPWGQIPPYSYGVHAEPVADLLKDEYQLPARATKGMGIEDLKKEIASGQPVIAWVIGNMVGGTPEEYTDQAGERVKVAPYEHTVIITGYGEDHIRYLNNGKFYQVPVDVFLNSWGVLGNMAVYHHDWGENY